MADEAGWRAELATLNAGKLGMTAKKEGASDAQLEAAEEAPNDKQALIDLIVSLRTGLEDIWRTELATLNASKLGKMAKKEGASDAQLEAAEEAPDDKQALIDLIVELRTAGPPPARAPAAELASTAPAVSAPIPTPSFMRPQPTLLDLVNELQSKVNVDLNLPEFCSVGAQGAGKSTFLAGIVSSQMGPGIKFPFLPEGGAKMVTRCPFVIQMKTEPTMTEHECSIHIPPCVENSWVLGGQEHTVGAKAPADPTPKEMEAWGNTIRKDLEATQTGLVDEGHITHTQITVRLTGPKMLNLTLVDLPGLILVEKVPGTQKLIAELVHDKVKDSNKLICCVVQSNVDQGTWLGLKECQEMDLMGGRTIGVMNKVDLLFKEESTPETDTIACRAQMTEKIQESKDNPEGVQWYAAHNRSPPLPEVEKAALEAKLSGFFEPDRVGNQAIAAFLVDKLNAHLSTNFKNIVDDWKTELVELTEELQKWPHPNWHMVDDVVMHFVRFVDCLHRGEDIKEVTDCSDKANYGNKKNLVTYFKSIDDKLQENKTNFQGGDIFDHPLVRKSDLMRDAKAVIGATIAYQIDNTTNKSKDQSLVCDSFAKGVVDQLQDIVNGAADFVSSRDGLVQMYMQFFDHVAKLKYEYQLFGSDEVSISAQSMENYTMLWDNVKTKTEKWLIQKAKAISKEYTSYCKKNPGIPVETMEKQWMTADANFDVLHRLLYAHLKQPFPHNGEVTTQPLAPTVSKPKPVELPEVPEVPELVGSLETACWKQPMKGFSIFGSWAQYFIVLKVDDATGAGAQLNIYKSEGAFKANPLGIRASSLPDLTGFEVGQIFEPTQQNGKFRYRLRLYHEASDPKESVFDFQDEATRDHFSQAFSNVAAGRPWNVSAERNAWLQDCALKEQMRLQQEEEDRLRREREAETEVEDQYEHEDDAECAVCEGHDLKLDPAVIATVKKDMAMYNVTKQLADGSKFQLMQPAPTADKIGEVFGILSPMFAQYVSELQPGEPVDEARMELEARAESYRMWTQKYLTDKIEKCVTFVSDRIYQEFKDHANPNSALSPIALLRCISVAKMAEGHGGMTPEKLLSEPAGAVAAGRQAKRARKKCLKKAIGLCGQPEYARFNLVSHSRWLGSDDDD